MASERKDGVLAAITLSNIPSEFRALFMGSLQQYLQPGYGEPHRLITQ